MLYLTLESNCSLLFGLLVFLNYLFEKLAAEVFFILFDSILSNTMNISITYMPTIC